MMTLDLNSLGPQRLAPAGGSGALKPGSHFVQLYDDDSALLSSLRAFFSNGLRMGEAVVCIATSLHQAAIQDELRECGVNVEAARDAGTFISVDAAEALEKIANDGVPNDALFSTYVGELIERAAGSEGRHVRMFGEMVALLWASGRPDHASALEEMWNDLAKEYPFQLFCAYPVSAFGRGQVDMVSNVCAQHTHVLPPN